MPDNIVDTTKPSPGRIYDYFLGGNHNFEVDRQSGDYLIQLLPYIPKAARLQRWSLQSFSMEFAEKRGYDVIIDFASGLPTNDHIHQVVPKGTTVIYSDFDPVVVEYSHEILKDVPNVHFFLADLCKPEELLENPEVQKILGGRRKVAFGVWGVSAFLTNEEISHTMRVLFDWAAPGSCAAFNAQMADIDTQDPVAIQVSQIYERMGSKLTFRTLETFRELIQPWKLEDEGFVSLLEWHGFDKSELVDQDTAIRVSMGSGYGAYLLKS